MTRNNKRKKQDAGKGRQHRAGLFFMAMLLTVMAAGCSKEPSEPTPSGTGGRVTFTGNTVEISEAKVGDTVRFGSYEQDNDKSNGAEAIEWLVLDKQDGKLLLLSKDALDCKKYNEENTSVTWETCTLRGWLNGTFYNTAFSQTEQGRIATTKVRNEDNPEYGTEGGNDTEDKVFLLSIGEATRYFDPDPAVDDPARCAKVTAYAKAQGADVNSNTGNGWWWLRSPGVNSHRAAAVYNSGYVDRRGYVVSCNGFVVRPAFWLNLEDASPSPTPTPKPSPTPTPKPTPTPSGTAFTPSGTGGRVTFTGNTVDISKAKVGDTVRFGNYEQDNNLSNGAEAIEWLVLDKQDGKLLLLSKDALDAKPYNEKYEDVTWETCTLRNWLNGTFYTTAFSQTEQGHIVTTKVKNEDNPEYGTEDKVFLLSIGEARSYFDSDFARCAKYFNNNRAWWWLRSPGKSDNNAADVGDSGYLNVGGLSVGTEYGGVRPAFWLNLESVSPSTAFTPSGTGGRVTFTGKMVEISKAEVGDTVLFGSYNQSYLGSVWVGDNTGTVWVGDNIRSEEAIEWLVLDKQDGKLLLLSKYVLDAKPYNNERWGGVTSWETCTLRNWLNSTFYYAAFSAAERGRIATTKVKNEDNPEWGTKGGNDTEDKVFLLSIGEAGSYFDSASARCAKGTAYVKAQGAYDGSSGDAWWWLRSPGRIDNYAAYVYFGGFLSMQGDDVSGGSGGVRPAFWLNLEDASPTPTPSGTAFTPSGTGGRVTFTGNTVEVSKAKVGDTVQFGSYEQDNDLRNGAEAIEWFVLDKQDGKLLLLSKYVLDKKRYNEISVSVTWEKCDLRGWLNGTFYTTAFSQTEQGRIATTKVRNEDNPKWGNKGGNDTEDKIFLLSIGEAGSYFDSDSARCAKYFDGNEMWWWLRSPGGSVDYAAGVHHDGSLYMDGSYIRYDYGVRPAFWLNLEDASPSPTPTPKPSPTPTPKPTQTPSGTAFTPSGTGGRVTFTGNTVEISKAKVGDTVRFGSYEQDNNLSNGAEAIEWLVLDKQDGKLLLLSKDALDCKKYNETSEGVKWETCTLRNWLNGTFYNTAFSTAERGRIVTTKVKNEDNPEWGTEGGNDTKDKVFLLSIGEVLNYFASDPDAYDPARRAKVTAYAKAQGGWTSSDSSYAGIGWWWLRSPGNNRFTAAGVNVSGDVGRYGFDVGGNSVSSRGSVVRPAFWLNLESATPKPTSTPKPTPTPKPSGTAFTPSGTGGRVTFTGNTAEVSEAKVGDTVRFGSYEQDNDTSNGAEAIEWLVLDKQDGKLLLLSKDALDCKKYNETREGVEWETCTLRKWLNGTFYNTAFRTAERGRIATTKVKNEDNPAWGTEGGNDTEDKVFLLSIGEVLNYFDSAPNAYDPARRAKVTTYAEAQGGGVYSEAEDGWYGTTEYDGNGFWWLRSPGTFNNSAAYVDVNGYVDRGGVDVSNDASVVRPAFWLNLEDTSPSPTPTPKPTSTPKPTPTPKPSGTAFTPSGTGGRVTFTGNTVEISKAKVGDTVRFGNYEQDNDTSNGAEAIEWLVLDKQDGKLLLLSKDALDCKEYNETYTDVTWETCTLRGWLNGTFYTTAFSTAERGRIATTKVKNEDNPYYNTEGGNDTEDKVFLLSIGEVLNYFDSDPDAFDLARRAKVTAYAEAQGGGVYSEAEDGWYGTTEYDGNGWWWLRSPGGAGNHAAGVGYDGNGGRRYGSPVIYAGDVVRPAFWLNLES